MHQVLPCDPFDRYSPEKVFKVVADVERYNEFVPWCLQSKIVPHPLDDADMEWKAQHPTGKIFYADLAVGYQIFKECYTSRVHAIPNEYVEAQAMDMALFHNLHTFWRFLPVSNNPDECEVLFCIDFEFKSMIYAYVTNLFFNEVVKGMVKAFEHRCELIYN